MNLVRELSAYCTYDLSYLHNIILFYNIFIILFEYILIRLSKIQTYMNGKVIFS